MPFDKKKSMFDMSDVDMTGKKVASQINSGVEGAEKELENLSFVKNTGRKDRSKDDPFANLGL